MKIDEVIKCPSCLGSLVRQEGFSLCVKCQRKYSFNSNGQPKFIERFLYENDKDFEHIEAVSTFWGKGWQNRNTTEHQFLDFDIEQLQEYGASYVNNKPYGVGGLFDNDIDFSELHGQLGLIIGPGAGNEAIAIMCEGKANLIALDATEEAIRTNQIVMDTIGSGRAIQGDARHLPIESGSIDFVYSSGVLHHSHDIERSVAEIYRILKPQGRAFIGLYSSTSIHFQKRNLLSLLSGKFSKQHREEFLSENTEAAWVTEGLKNPLTKIFSRKECQKLFCQFKTVKIRQGGGLVIPDKPIIRWLKPLEKSKFFAKFGLGIYSTLTK